MAQSNISGLKVIKHAHSESLYKRLFVLSNDLIKIYGYSWNGDNSRILTSLFHKNSLPNEIEENKDIKFLIKKYSNELVCENIFLQKYSEGYVLDMHIDGMDSNRNSRFKRVAIINLIAEDDLVINKDQKFVGAVRVGAKSNDVIIMEGPALNYYHGIEVVTGPRFNMVIRYV